MLRKGHVAMGRPLGTIFRAWAIAGRWLRMGTGGGKSLVLPTHKRGPGHSQQDGCLGWEPLSDACLSPES